MDLYSPAAKQVIASNQRTDSFTGLGLLSLPRGYLGMAPPLASNNYRGIPPRYSEAVNHRRKARWRSLLMVEVLKSAAIPREQNFQINLSPKGLT